MFLMLRILGWAVAIFLYTLFGYMMLWLTGFLVFTPPGWLSLPAVVVFWVAFGARLRRRRGTALLGQLEHSVKMNMPLAEMVQAQADSERGVLGQRLHQVGWRLREGLSLGDALKLDVPEVPQELSGMIAAEEQVGRLPEALSYAVSQRRAQDQAEPANWAMMWGYPAAIIMIVVMVVTGVILFIVPKFIMIFEDFGAQLPGATVGLIEFTNWFGGQMLGLLGAEDYNHDQPVAGVVWFLLLGALGFILWTLVKAGPMRPAWDRVAWRLPWSRRRALGDGAHVIQQSLVAGEPVHAAVRRAGSCGFNAVLGARLHRWAGLLEAGQPLGQSARKARMPALVAELVGPAEQSGNLAEAFGFANRHYRQGAEHWVAAIRGGLTTLAVMVLAAVVGFIVYALFLPLVKLIESVMPLGMEGAVGL